MPHNTKRSAYRKRLEHWAIARLLPNMRQIIVGRFRSRSDADGHLQCLRQLIPHASFVVVFDLEPDIEPATNSPTSTEEVVV
jgi:muramoyltetrapeptide carboxypeptidase LdcA involved in peptidoglycan recycling